MTTNKTSQAHRFQEHLFNLLDDLDIKVQGKRGFEKEVKDPHAKLDLVKSFLSCATTYRTYDVIFDNHCNQIPRDWLMDLQDLREQFPSCFEAL